MKQIEVRLPRNSKELRIKHFASMAMLPVKDFSTDRDRILFLSEFLGLHYNEVLRFRISDIAKMAKHAAKAISKMDLTSALPETIELKGQRFCLVDPDKIGIGWHIDFSATSIKKDPVRLACLFYVPEGFNYSDVDQNGNLEHPIASRYDLFEREFPLDLFIRSSDFFLRKSLHSIRRSMVQESARKKLRKTISSAVKRLNPFNGKRASMQ